MYSSSRKLKMKGPPSFLMLSKFVSSSMLPRSTMTFFSPRECASYLNFSFGIIFSASMSALLEEIERKDIRVERSLVAKPAGDLRTLSWFDDDFHMRRRFENHVEAE